MMELLLCMSGIRSGVATRILQEEPRALYTHCYGHSLNLACSHTIKKCTLMRNALDIVHEITKLVKKLPRRDSTLVSIKQQLSYEGPGIRICVLLGGLYVLMHYKV